MIISHEKTDLMTQFERTQMAHILAGREERRVQGYRFFILVLIVPYLVASPYMKYFFWNGGIVYVIFAIIIIVLLLYINLDTTYTKDIKILDEAYKNGISIDAYITSNPEVPE